MNIAEIDALIEKYQQDLNRLQPTLRPKKDMPFSKVVLLNTARRKAKKLESEINVLKILRKNPAVADTVMEALEIVPSQSNPFYATGQEKPTGQLIFGEEAPGAGTESVIDTIRRIYGK